MLTRYQGEVNLGFLHNLVFPQRGYTASKKLETFSSLRYTFEPSESLGLMSF